MKLKIKQLTAAMTEHPQNKKKSHKKIEYLEHIPGGKRFWRVGNLYELKKGIQLSFHNFGIEKVSAREHKIYNNNWRERNKNNPFLSLAKDWISLQKGSIVMLIEKPDYKTVLAEEQNSMYFLFNTPLVNSYQIKVFYQNKIGWILLNKDISPRVFFDPIK